MTSDPVPVAHEDYSDLDRPVRRRTRRADVYTAVAVVSTLLCFLMVFYNLFVAPICGIVGLVAAWLAWRNGGPRPLLLAIILIDLVPTGFVLLALLFLLINLPLQFHLNGIKIVDG